MRKDEIPKMKDNELIRSYVSIYSLLIVNYNLNRGVKQLQNQCTALEKELVKRGLLTEEDIKRLNT